MNKSAKTTMINGVATDYLNINDRAIHYGDGIFETILCDHDRLLYWKQHYQRLQSSATRLKMNCPDEQLLLDDIKQLLDGIEHSVDDNFAIKVIISRGISERGYRFPKGHNENRVTMLSTLEPGYSSLLAGKLLSGDLYLCEQQISINESLAGLKHLNRLENVLASNEWQNGTTDNTIIDGLMINANHYVIEGTMSNLFTVKGKRLITPDLKYSGVNGIMRDVIIDIAKQNDIEISVVNMRLDELYSMDELFISNSLIGLKAVNKIAQNTFSSHDITNLIFDALLKNKDKHAQIV
ncbi:MAG: aminodeoxychorismate lyase [Gammaproteobacteria bacterium]|nr:aminodeoxychorismate lyase [Gammaproteobacteria bacterium]